jgi:hypothetical protein
VFPKQERELYDEDYESNGSGDNDARPIDEYNDEVNILSMEIHVFEGSAPCFQWVRDHDEKSYLDYDNLFKFNKKTVTGLNSELTEFSEVAIANMAVIA